MLFQIVIIITLCLIKGEWFEVNYIFLLSNTWGELFVFFYNKGWNIFIILTIVFTLNHVWYQSPFESNFGITDQIFVKVWIRLSSIVGMSAILFFLNLRKHRSLEKTVIILQETFQGLVLLAVFIIYTYFIIFVNELILLFFYDLGC